MSQYIHFFVRKNDTFIPIFSNSRSSDIYDRFDGLAPCDKIRKISEENVRDVIQEIDARIANLERAIRNSREELEILLEHLDDVGEKKDAIENAMFDERDYRESIDDLKDAKRFAQFIFAIINEMDEDVRYEYEDDAPAMGVYVGVDTGIEVTVDDIQ